MRTSPSPRPAGAAQAGQLGFDPNPADFGVVAVGTTSAAITVKITNGGARR
jgi:hypothetical protein